MIKDVSIFIKFSDDNIEGYSTIEEHRKIIKNKKKVIWGQSRRYSNNNNWSGLGKDIVKKIEKQTKTDVYLCDTNNSKLYKANLLNHYDRFGNYNYKTKGEPINKIEYIKKYIPNYYMNQIDLDDNSFVEGELVCYLFLEFDKIEEINFNEVNNITLYKNKKTEEKKPILSIKNQSSVFYTKLINNEMEENIKKRKYNFDDFSKESKTNKKNAEEGKQLNRTHKEYERDSELVRNAKIDFKEKNGRLFCEICNFDFEEVYGERGRDYIEAHHNEVPIHKMNDNYKTEIDEFMMLCSNCHTIIHRLNDGFNTEELKIILEKDK